MPDAERPFFVETRARLVRDTVGVCLHVLVRMHVCVCACVCVCVCVCPRESIRNLIGFLSSNLFAI